jgi:zinc transporter ZupT
VGGCCRRADAACRQPLTYLILIGDGLHNFLGGMITYASSLRIDVDFLVPLAAGNFLCIAASELVPAVNRHLGWRTNLVHLAALANGILLFYLLVSG